MKLLFFFVFLKQNFPSNCSGKGGGRGPTSLEVGPSRTLWKANVPDTASEKYYNFSKYACELNEEEDGVCPTDSRLRPDQRLMEEGQWDDANTEKVR